MDSEDEHPDMLKAIELCRRILKRDFYQNLGTVHATDTQNCFRNCKTCEDDKKYQHEYRGQPKEKLENDLRNFVRQQDESLNAEDFVVVLSKASMGMGNSNPIHKVPFYDREGKVTGVNEDLSRFFHFEIFYILFRSMDIEACLKALNVTKLFLDNNNING